MYCDFISLRRVCISRNVRRVSFLKIREKKINQLSDIGQGSVQVIVSILKGCRVATPGHDFGPRRVRISSWLEWKRTVK